MDLIRPERNKAPRVLKRCRYPSQTIAALVSPAGSGPHTTARAHSFKGFRGINGALLRTASPLFHGPLTGNPCAALASAG